MNLIIKKLKGEIVSTPVEQTSLVGIIFKDSDGGWNNCYFDKNLDDENVVEIDSSKPKLTLTEAGEQLKQVIG